MIPETESTSMTGNSPTQRNLTLNLEQGLHIRACSLVVDIVSNFDGPVSVTYNGKSADAASMFDLLELAVLPDASVVVEASGPEADGILDQIEQLFSLRKIPEA